MATSSKAAKQWQSNDDKIDSNSPQTKSHILLPLLGRFGRRAIVQ